jgi:hypothetical protein
VRGAESLGVRELVDGALELLDDDSLPDELEPLLDDPDDDPDEPEDPEEEPEDVEPPLGIAWAPAAAGAASANVTIKDSATRVDLTITTPKVPIVDLRLLVLRR